MSLHERLLDPSRPLTLYGTTPPRADAAEERIEAAATKLAARVGGLALDGLIVYDVQDESGRTDRERPFPFLPTMDSRSYSRRLSDLTGLAVVTYKSIGRMTAQEWREWLTVAADEYGVEYLTPVGRPSSHGAGYPLSLSDAIRSAARHPAGFTLGGVAIAERHLRRGSESRRMLKKAEDGCSFFVSQGVYDPAPTIEMLSDYERDCRQAGISAKRVVLTFTPCGRAKTVAFIRWLGMSIAEETERTILSAQSPVAKSIEICCENLQKVLSQPNLTSVPLGVNVESVSIMRFEIEASVELARRLGRLLADTAHSATRPSSAERQSR